MLPFKQLIIYDKSLNTPVYLQLVNVIIREINNGRLTSGLKIPGTREMATLLDLNRKTITIAYEELMAQGWLEIKPSRGTFISEALPHITYREIGPNVKRNKGGIMDCGFSFSASFEGPYYEAPPSNHLEIDEGSPDERIAPIEVIYRYSRSLIRSGVGRKLLKYQDEKGDLVLRKTLVRYLAETRGLVNDFENIMITRGSQMAIYLAFQALVGEGDYVVVGDTNYAAANASILNAGAKLLQVNVDQNGINTDDLASICQTKKVRGVYITPHHHFPTTVTLSADRRMHLLKLAEQYKFAIIEDDYDYDFHYASNPILPLASMDQQGLVIYIGAFSKLLAPSIRVGYLVGPQRFVKAIARLRRNIDRQGDPLLERSLALMIKDGEFQRHLKKSFNIYHQRRALCCQLLAKLLGKHIEFSPPEGGMVIWLKFKPYINIESLALGLKKHQVLINTQKEFVLAHNAIRFGFASLNENEITKAINALAQVISTMES